MVNFTYPVAIDKLGDALLDLPTADLRIMLLLQGTTAGDDDANRDVTTVSGFTTLKEHTAAGRIALTGLSWDKVAASNWSVLSANSPTWDPLVVASGGEDVVAALMYLHVTTDADSWPVAWIDDGGYPVTPTGLTRHTINFINGALRIQTGT